LSKETACSPDLEDLSRQQFDWFNLQNSWCFMAQLW